MKLHRLESEGAGFEPERKISRSVVGRRRLNRRTAVVALAASALVLAGCTPGDAGEEPAATGGTLIQVIAGDPATLNPALTTGNPDLSVACKVFEGLIRLDASFDVQPGLAETWEVAEDGLTYTFNLREGVEWHDGEPLVAQDVVWTYENVTSVFHPRGSAAFETVSSIEAPDDHTVVITMSEPYGPFLPSLTCANGAVLPEHIYGDAEGDEILSHPRNKENPIGTGPFKFESWESGRQITLVKNDNYWRASEGMPYLDRIILQPLGDVQAAAAALEAGEVDVITDYTLDVRTYDRLHEEPGIMGQANTNWPANYVLVFNTTEGPMAEKLVRQAVAHALDRDFITERVFSGYGSAGTSAIDSRITWAHNPDVDYRTMYDLDLEKAADLLDEAGYPADSSGKRMEISLPFGSDDAASGDIGQIIRDHLGKVGITVNIEPMERSVMLETVFANRDFDASIQRYTTLGDPALGIQRIYVSSAITGRPFTNASGYSNPEVDALFAEGESYSDYERRAVPYFEAQEIIAEDMPTLVINENPTQDLARDVVEGLWKAPDSMEWWETVSISQ